MKITKRQLRRVIREEKQKLLREGLTQEENLADAITEYVNALAEQLGEDPLDLKPDVMGQVDAWFEAEAEMDYGGGWDEADQDHANQQYAAQHGDPYENN